MKRLKFLLATMLVAVTVIGSFAFTDKGFHGKALTNRCFVFTDNPLVTANSTTVQDPLNWAEINPGSVDCQLNQQICVICFDDTVYPVTVIEGIARPDFENSPDLVAEVVDEYNQPSNGDGFLLNGITYYYRPFN